MIDHVSDEALSAHLDGALDDPEERRLASHLATCRACVHRLELLGATARAISGLPGEPLPAPLDLSFLAPRTASDPLVMTMRGRWHPPAWAAPVLAAAAILLVAVTVGPGLLPHGGASTATSSQAGSSSDRYALAPVPGPPSAQPSGLIGGGAPAAGAVPNAGSAPFATTPGARATKTFAQSGGAVVELSARQKVLRAGQLLTVNLAVHAGATVLQTQRSDISVSRDSASVQEASAGSETIAPGQFSSLSGIWVAGKLGSGAETPGDYVVVGEVTLSDGNTLSVSFAIHVS